MLLTTTLPINGSRLIVTQCLEQELHLKKRACDNMLCKYCSNKLPDKKGAKCYSNYVIYKNHNCINNSQLKCLKMFSECSYCNLTKSVKFLIMWFLHENSFKIRLDKMSTLFLLLVTILLCTGSAIARPNKSNIEASTVSFLSRFIIFHNKTKTHTDVRNCETIKLGKTSLG